MKNYQKEIMFKRQKEKRKINKEWVESGDYEKAKNILNKKRDKSNINHPFDD